MLISIARSYYVVSNDGDGEGFQKVPSGYS